MAARPRGPGPGQIGRGPRVSRYDHGPWLPPFRLCDFCRLPLGDQSRAAMEAHLAGCAEYTAYRLDPKLWLREYWLVRGTAMMRLTRVAGRPDPDDPERILSTPQPGRTFTPIADPIWGVLGGSVFNHPDLARGYGAWRLGRLAAEYERLAEHFRGDKKIEDETGHLDHRILTLPR